MLVIGTVAVQRLRAGWRAWAALALLTGLAGGAVLAAVAGARRTDSAFPRFLSATAAADVLVSPAQSGVGGFDLAIGELPGVRQIAPVVGINAYPLSADGKIDQAAEVLAPIDGRLGHALERPRMLAGRQPRADRPSEVLVDQIAAQQLGLRVGSALRLAAMPNAPNGRIRRLTVRVVGVEVIAASIVPVNQLAQTAYIQASPALYRQLGPAYGAFDGDYVLLGHGTTVDRFTNEATRLVREPEYRSTGGQLFVSDQSAQEGTVERAIRPQAIALAIFALVLALTAFLVLGQAASRLLLAASADNPVLSALGLTRRQLFAVGLLQVLVCAVAGALLACVIAIAASTSMPIGPAKLAELHPGLSFDATVLVSGCGAIVVLLLARVSWTAWQAAGILAQGPAAGPTTPGYGSRFARWLAGAGASVTAVIGVRMAFEPGRGRTGAPMHGALAGIALSVAAVMASATFGANLTHLERTPHLYGQNWDAALDLQFGTITASRFAALIAPVPGLTDWTFGLHGTVTLIGHGGVVPAIALTRGRGLLLMPTMLAGHPPRSGEVVLGALTMRQSRLQLGQSVEVSASSRPQRARLAGRAVFPYFGQGSFTPTDLGRGALVPASMLAAQAAQAYSPGFNFVLVKFAPGMDKATGIAALTRATAKFCAAAQQSTCVVVNQQPNGLIDYARIDTTPLILAGLLAILGLGVLAQFAFQSGKARRRDFAVLRTLGLRRGQLAVATCWQISAITAVALVIGLPAGAAAGRWAWALFADVLGMSPGSGSPIKLGLLLIPCALAAANLVALAPGRSSTRPRPAELLRAE
jgi:putative ABC transport system permease protein